jgi:thioredoxin 1
MRELSSQNPTVGYQIIDIDDNIGIAQEYGVRAVPTIVFEKNGSVVETVIGVQQKSYYQSLINSM